MLTYNVDQFLGVGRSTDENLFTDYPRTKIPDLCVDENKSQKNRDSRSDWHT